MAVISGLLWWAGIVLPLFYMFYQFISGFMAYIVKRRTLMKLPGMPPNNPIMGHIAELSGPDEDGLRVMRGRMEEYPRLNYVFLGLLPSVGISHPETAKAIFKTSEPKPRNFGGIYNFLFPWLGDGLLISTGKKWSRNRRLMTPAFHFDILRPYVKVNNDAASLLLGKMGDFAKKYEYFEVFNQISLCTFDIILRCAFSYDNNCQMQGRPWLYPDFIFRLSSVGRKFHKNCDFVHSLANDIIKSRRKQLESGFEAKSRYLDFLDILLTAKDTDGAGLTDLEIRQEVDTFMFEGHDTTASGISWALYSLASNPDHQRRCQEELDRVLAGRDSDEILWEDLSKLKYLSQCVKESLRLHVPVPFIQRITTKDMFLEGHFIPKGTNISLQLFQMLHNPTVWEAPSEFRPERFSEENADTLGSHSFVPFSAGPRNCIGQHFALHEMKVVIGRILRSFNLELKPGHPVGHYMTAVMRAEHGIYMKVCPREHA